MNPYSNVDFFGFFLLFFKRFFSGAMLTPVTDEVQALVLIGVSLSSALVGTFLVLRKMTMLANSLSHTILLGIVMAFIFAGGSQEIIQRETLQVDAAPLLIAALVMGFITVYLTQFLTTSVKLQEDAAIGMVFTTLFALGILAVSILTRSSHIGTESVMGNVDALHVDDLKLVYLVFIINAVITALFFKEFKLVSFDPILAASLGFSVPFFSHLMMGQASFAIISSFRSTGVLMVLAFLVMPPLIARLFTHRLEKMILLSLFIGSFTSLSSVALARHLLTVQGIAVSTAGLTVTLLAAVFIFSALAQQVNKKFTRFRPSKIKK